VLQKGWKKARPSIILLFPYYSKAFLIKEKKGWSSGRFNQRACGLGKEGPIILWLAPCRLGPGVGGKAVQSQNSNPIPEEGKELNQPHT
jgi:hypothetical protein